MKLFIVRHTEDAFDLSDARCVHMMDGVRLCFWMHTGLTIEEVPVLFVYRMERDTYWLSVLPMEGKGLPVRVYNFVAEELEVGTHTMCNSILEGAEDNVAV